jgi:uncharacterized repeat protein (TIGR03803 family)
MKTQMHSQLLLALALAGLALSQGIPARAQTETTLHSFADDANGYNPVASLTLDSSGNLFGTTSEGGNFTGCPTGCGVVFELSPISGGGWSESVPETFAGGHDGANPFVGLTPDGLGNYYGATGDGGNISKNPLGLGTIFKLSPNGSGGWTKTTIHVFNGGAGGSDPYGKLIFDSAGNLYGTAHNGGQTVCDCGIVFELSPISGGGWKETALHAFNAKNGSFPNAGLIFDSAGNLYGTTTFGGPGCTSALCGNGLVFELSPISGGGWKEEVLYAFENGSDGGYPDAGVIFDTAGNLYGTTQQAGITGGACGPDGCGVVFELSPKSGGGWKETVVHSFSGTDGNTPRSGLVLAASGILYGTTYFGGTSSGAGCGIVYQLSPASGGGWTEATTYNFTCGIDGAYPEADLITDSSGILYSTTQYGGANGRGTVYEITP